MGQKGNEEIGRCSERSHCCHDNQYLLILLKLETVYGNGQDPEQLRGTVTGAQMAVRKKGTTPS